jgi:single-strand DNA-binding protein
MNEVQVTVVGMVCSDVKYTKTDEGVAAARFQIRSMPRRFDSKRSAWSDGEPSYYSATCWRQLADNVAASMNSGDPVVVHGRLSIDRWRKGDDKMVSATIDVQAIGHDLRWGTSAYRRGGGPVFVPAAAVGGPGDGGGAGDVDGAGGLGSADYRVGAMVAGQEVVTVG